MIGPSFGVSDEVRRQTAWDLDFLGDAIAYSRRSKDPSTKVGAIVVRPDLTVASHGYNGFPRGVRDLPDRYEDRSFKYPAVVHAELNAITMAKESLAGCTLYSTMSPCGDCAGVIIQSGIRRVVSITPTGAQIERWAKSFEVAKTMFFEAGVSVVYYDLREVCTAAVAKGLNFSPRLIVFVSGGCSDGCGCSA